MTDDPSILTGSTKGHDIQGAVDDAIKQAGAQSQLPESFELLKLVFHRGGIVGERTTVQLKHERATPSD